MSHHHTRKICDVQRTKKKIQWPIKAICSHLHNHEILVDLSGDSAEQRSELILARGDLSVPKMKKGAGKRTE